MGVPIGLGLPTTGFFWRRPRTANAAKLKTAVDALFRVMLERRSFLPAYPAALVCQHQAHNIFHREAISNYFSSTFWGEATLGKDFSNEDYLQIFARAMLDLILQYCHNEVRMDLAYNSYAAPTPGTWGVPSIVTRERKIPVTHSDNL
jgi:hypothetical protein